jgi:hypothetical protein
MGPVHDDREPLSEPITGREPLVDLGVKPPQPGELPKGSRPRRKRLSDIEGGRDETPPQPQPKPQGRLILTSSPTAPGEPQGEAQPPSGPRRPRLVDVTAPSDGQELHPRPGRPRLALTLSSDDMPGLQTIVDMPPAADDITPSRHARANLLAPESCTERTFSLALIGGLVAALVGATLWALLAVATSYHLASMAIGVGLLVGGAVRLLGRGTDRSCSRLSVALVIFGCLLGNLLSVCLVLAGQKGLAPWTVLSYVCTNPTMVPAAFIAMFRSLDPLFYGLALYAGYRLSLRKTSEAR